MAQDVHRAPDVGDAAGHPRRGFIVNHHDGFELVGFIGTEPGFQKWLQETPEVRQLLQGYQLETKIEDFTLYRSLAPRASSGSPE